MSSSCFFSFLKSYTVLFFLLLCCRAFMIWHPSAAMQSSRFGISLCFFLFACSCVAPAFSLSTTNATELYSTLSFFTSYYTGGESLIGKLPHHTTFNYFVKKYARLQIQQHCETNGTGIYEVKGYLLIQFPYWYVGEPGDGSIEGSYGASRDRGEVRFWLRGLWSETARQLKMDAIASWVVEGKTIILKAFLDLHYPAQNNPTLYNGYISGTLSSLMSASDPGYFDPFSIFSFPLLPNYHYSLLSQVQGEESSTASDVAGAQWPMYEGNKYCWVIMGESIVLELEYAEECSEDHHHCSPLGTGDGLIEPLPRLLLFTPIQCSAVERKMRYMAIFQYTIDDQGFGLNSTLIGEASWDDKTNGLSGVACRLLDPLNRTANEVGDCSMRLSLMFTSIITVRNDPKLVGRFRSTKHADKSGYFRKIILTKSDWYGLVTLPYVRYEYTKLDELRRSCAVKKPMKRWDTNKYPDVSSEDMRFGLSLRNSSGQHFGWISTSPLWVGNNLYQTKNVKMSAMQQSGDEAPEISEPYHSKTSHSNISYMIRLNSHSELEFGSPFESSYLSYYSVEITAEGVYNAETGNLCMVGCRKLKPNGSSTTYISRDCEILVTLQLAPLTGERDVHAKGTITSTRPETDPLHFEEMILYSNAYNVKEAARAIWRMDMEIVMVLISDTLVCIFVALQIFHVRRNSKVPPFISLFMLLILSVGHMIPLILNFEDAHLGKYRTKHVKAINSGGRLESNEAAVRLSSLVAFLLQLRLLQLVWTAKGRDENGSSSWSGERKPGFVLLALYAVSALLALLLNHTKAKTHTHQVNGKFAARQRYSEWGSLRSYGGLIMDGFLLPQVLLNAFTGSAEKALSHSFYGGISALRLAPHAYNLYRVHNYPAFDLKKTYYYANPFMGFYSRAWDIFVPFAILMLALIIFLQQRRHGRSPAS